MTCCVPWKVHPDLQKQARHQGARSLLIKYFTPVAQRGFESTLSPFCSAQPWLVPERPEWLCGTQMPNKSYRPLGTCETKTLRARPEV